MNGNLHFIFICLFLWVLIGGCQQRATNPYKEQDAFFGQPRFNGNYFKTFNLLEADTVVAHIRLEVPPQWQGWACQAAYYNLEGEVGVTDSIIFRLLDKLTEAFPADSTLAFLDMIRGEMFTKTARYDTAQVCFKKAYDLCMKIPNPMLAADVVNNFAELALHENDYPEATRLYLNNYNYYSQLDTSMEKGRLFNILKKLCSVYTKSENLTEAHKWCLKTYDYAMTGPVTRRSLYTVESGTFLARSYVALQQWDSAQIMLDTVAYFQKNHGGNYYEEDLRMFLRARIQLGKGNCNAALPLFLAAKRMQKDPTNVVRIHRYNKELADGYACQGRLDSAIYLYKTALATPDTAFRVKILDALSKAYTLRGDYKQAYAYKQQCYDLHKQIFTNGKEQAIGRLHAREEVEKRERALEAQQSQTRLNWVLMVSGLVVLSSVVIIGFFAFKRKRQELQLAEQTRELLRQEQQLKERALVATKQELEVKETALAEVMEQLNLKNLLIQTLEMQLTDDTHATNVEKDTQLHSLKILTPEDWRKFRYLFEERHIDFFPKLSQHFPKLTTSEIRLFMLIKLGFGSKEIADVLGISAQSVYVSRSRLRQRLAINKEDDLEQFIQQF